MPSFAATRLINPPGVEPVLSVDQVWKGLQRKARDPKRFVPAITECRVDREEGNKMTRIARFGEGTPEMREEVTAFDNCIVYFETTSLSEPARADSDPDFTSDPHRTRITNTISYGPSNELFLTFSFAPRMPHVSDEQAQGMSQEEINGIVGKGVQQTVDVIREMVRAGEL
ncbi:hypothetical protein JCM10908_005845 [Rhodotorula pacifica]|uniref:SRPBCC family protein n=1 Tax=Rhodotorula pacifica TaxID=1495444 RepID=UPI00317362AD